jgi:NADP-dependent 3-hydroxy acid dehydrogenase YdfG
LAKGDKVSATARKTALFDDLVAKYPSSQLIVVRLDVTSGAEVSEAFAKTVKTFGRVDVVYNNAAVATFGELEATNEASERKNFDVNFWGAVNVSKEAVRVFQDVNKPVGGHLIQASSLVTVNAYPIMAFYTAR